ncbi:hypothetical protein B9Z55_007799 [Caenorhabditis nigoni]|nr:hypothetical protein B9Z55_007799 [Caenorhabditis nigoni]
MLLNLFKGPGAIPSPKQKEVLAPCESIVPDGCKTVEECTSLIIEKCIEKVPGISVALFEAMQEDPKSAEALRRRQQIPSDAKAKIEQLIGPFCKDFMTTHEYKKGNKDHPGYIFCCEMLDYCSFYVQTWFYIVCGVVGLLLLVGIAGGAFFFFYSKRKRMGK